MREESLERLAEALERVRQTCPDLAVWAIRWMYLRHPVHPIQQALMRGDASAAILRRMPGWFWLVSRCVLYAGSLSVRLIMLRVLLRRELAALRRQPFDLVAKTCCRGTQRFPNGRDFYYGDLQQRLAQRGVRMLLLCSDVLDSPWRTFARSQVGVGPVWQLPEMGVVPFWAPIHMMWKQLVSAGRLSRLARRLDDPLARAVAALAARDCLLPDTAFAGLTCWVAKAAVRLWHPKAFMTFYEGHAWERCAWWGAKTADASCRTIGYQHSMIFRECLSMTAPTGDHAAHALPDAVLCLGQVPLELMQRGPQASPVQFVRFGSFRYTPTHTQGPADATRRTVLVTPVGFGDGTATLFAFAVECAQRLPHYTFILRIFPGRVMPDVMQAMTPHLARLPNLVLSDRADIQDDYARSSIIMYRDSSSVLYGTLEGLLPVYVHVPSLIDTDPLYMLTSWRRVAATPDQFAAIVEAYEQMPDDQRAAEWGGVATYLRQYAEPVGEDAIEALLASIGIPPESPLEETRGSLGPRAEAASLERLAEAFGVVQRRCPELPVVAIRWMYLKHPLRPVQEALLQRTLVQRPDRGVWRWMVRCVLHAVHLSGRLIWVRLMMRRELATFTRTSFDLIGKTCCFGLASPPDGRDFYYGDLQHRLIPHGVRMLLLCSDVLDHPWRAFARRQTAMDAPVFRLPEVCVLSPLDPLRMVGRQLLASIRLRRLAACLTDRLERATALLASRDCLLPDTTLTGLTFWIARAAVQRWHPKAFMTFYEGHAWERCAWWGAKTADASCRTIGYQHSMIFRECLSMTAPTGDHAAHALPDAVLCLGQVPLELMQRGPQASPVQFVRFGSFRYTPTHTQGPADATRRTVLVTPVGFEDETSALFTFAIACAERLPHYTFVLRMFPGIAMPRVTALVEAAARHRSNVLVSDCASIDDDYGRSNILLYRGSTSVLYAALKGLLPVYLDTKALNTSDPLFLLTTWRRAAATPDQFTAVVDAYERMPVEARAREWGTAADYLNAYAGPVDDRAVDAFVHIAGIRTRHPEHDLQPIEVTP